MRLNKDSRLISSSISKVHQLETFFNKLEKARQQYLEKLVLQEIKKQLT